MKQATITIVASKYRTAYLEILNSKSVTKLERRTAMVYNQMIQKTFWLFMWLSIAPILGNGIQVVIPCFPRCNCEFTRMNCWNRSIQYVPMGWWPHIWKLSLRMNKISTLTEKDLRRFLSLRKLDIDGNKLEVLDLNALGGAPQLKSVIASNNRIHAVLPPSESLANLMHLDLSGNLLQTPPPRIVLEAAPNLRSLALAQNQFLSLEPMWHSNLRSLDMSATWHTEIPDDLFSGLPLLEYLNLADNSLWTLGSCLSDLDHLHSLNLRDNRITHVNKSNLPQFNTLRRLSFAQNPLEDLFPEDVEKSLLWRDVRVASVLDNATSVVYLMDTPAACDCHLHYLKQWSARVNVELWTQCGGKDSYWCTSFDELSFLRPVSDAPREKPNDLEMINFKSFDS